MQTSLQSCKGQAVTTLFLYNSRGNCKLNLSWLAEKVVLSDFQNENYDQRVHHACPANSSTISENTWSTQVQKIVAWVHKSGIRESKKGQLWCCGFSCSSCWGKNFKGNGPVPSVPVGSILHFGGSNVENEEALAGFHGIFWSLVNALWLSVIKSQCSHELDLSQAGVAKKITATTEAKLKSLVADGSSVTAWHSGSKVDPLFATLQ